MLGKGFGLQPERDGMKRWKALLLVLFAVAIAAVFYGAVLIRRGFSATEEPSTLEKIVARTVRNLSIPRGARNQENPWKATPENFARGT